MEIKIPRNVKRLYKEAVKESSHHWFGGMPDSELDWFTNRIGNKIDPIVEEVARENDLDLYSDAPYLMFDRNVLFKTLLISFHPIVNEGIQKIRNDLGIDTLYPNRKELVYDPDGNPSFVNKSLSELSDSIKQKLEECFIKFFEKFGNTIPQHTWKKPMTFRILTGTLPIPYFAPIDQFKIVKQSIKSNYPAIYIRRKIDQRELNALITFIREHEKELVEATKNLPDELIKRFDVDLTKLAIGLWVLKNEKNGNKWMDNWIIKKYEENEIFFGKYKGLNLTEFPNFKSDALVYLNQLYPLKS